MSDFLSSHPATIDGENGTVDIISSFGGEEHHWSLEIFRLTPAVGGYAGKDRFTAFLVVAKRFRIIGCDITRRNTVYVDSFGRPFVSKGFNKAGQSAFAGSVSGYKNPTLEAEQGTGEYDLPAAL